MFDLYGELGSGTRAVPQGIGARYCEVFRQSRYGQRVDLATCTLDSTPLRVLERRKGDQRGPLLVCPSCRRHFIVGSRGPEEVPAEA